MIPRRVLIPLLLLTTVIRSPAAGSYHEVAYPPSKNEGELVFGVTYRLWIPDGVKTLRGVIVHQHGCGLGSRKGAEPGAKDLHWQALAKKWDCALMAPSYHQEEKDNCRLWCDPRNGSEKTFLKSLADLGKQSGHPELEKVPWCLWGHSGGGFWSSLMLTRHPDRIAAIWFRSGSAFGAWTKGEIPAPEIPEAAYRVPVVFNGGVKEETDKRHGPARAADRAMFALWREHGAPAGFAPDPRTGHEAGDSRYLAIPFFDTCLAMRLPERAGQPLKPVNMEPAWLAAIPGDEAMPAAKFTVDAKAAAWLPDENFARLWRQYVKTGATEDTIPPPVPMTLKATAGPAGVTLTWDAEADFESGLQAFIIQRDGKDLAQHPEKPANKFGRPLFQNMSYGDTPVEPLPDFSFNDKTAQAGESHEYRIIAVNSAGLRSAPSATVRAKP
jgi:poly(3-hydroxybutyrate) depolymerase